MDSSSCVCDEQEQEKSGVFVTGFRSLNAATLRDSVRF